MKDITKLTAYVGTYTNGESKGIYRFNMDLRDGSIRNVKLAAEAENPTYLTIDKDNKYLYSVIKAGESGGAAAFRIDDSTEDLKLINYKVSKGKPPCHVSLDDKEEYLFSANYHKAAVEALPIGNNGEVQDISSIITHEDSRLHGKSEGKAHVHYAAMAPDKKHVCVVDLGLDKLFVYNFNDGILSEAKELSIQLRRGCGPRHMDFHPSGKFAYIVTELSGEVIALEYSEASCAFKEIQYISALPESYKGKNAGGAVRISADGKFLYSSNRGHDSIAVFSIDEVSGTLRLISHISTGGMFPRDFTIDPTGNFIIAANQNSSNIVVFKVDKTTGRLTPTGTDVSIPNPVCIKFLNA